MTFDKSTRIQILVAWRGTKWIVARDAVEVGAYVYRPHAMAAARAVAAEVARQGLDCYLLVREKDGAWSEHACPRPRARRTV